MFASKTITEHILCGSVGVGALAISAAIAPLHPVVSLFLIPLALVALRGCPMCWTIGLLQTLAAKVQGTKPRDACVDGRCALNAARALREG
jgi:hypothetical protein